MTPAIVDVVAMTTSVTIHSQQSLPPSRHQGAEADYPVARKQSLVLHVTCLKFLFSLICSLCAIDLPDLASG